MPAAQGEQDIYGSKSIERACNLTDLNSTADVQGQANGWVSGPYLESKLKLKVI
jgi:hypothetical protein